MYHLLNYYRNCSTLSISILPVYHQLVVLLPSEEPNEVHMIGMAGEMKVDVAKEDTTNDFKICLGRA